VASVVGSSSFTVAAAGADAWRRVQVAGDHALAAVSCPSMTMCVATDYDGRVVSSTDPARGVWTAPSSVTDAGELLSVSCPSSSLCVATDSSGRVFTSTDPAGGGRAWTSAAVDAYTLAGVSCPSIAFCVAVDEGSASVPSGVLTSTNPTGGAGAWTRPARCRGYAGGCVHVDRSNRRRRRLEEDQLDDLVGSELLLTRVSCPWHPCA
jgi:hypothetical protein